MFCTLISPRDQVCSQMYTMYTMYSVGSIHIGCICDCISFHCMFSLKSRLFYGHSSHHYNAAQRKKKVQQAAFFGTANGQKKTHANAYKHIAVHKQQKAQRTNAYGTSVCKRALKSTSNACQARRQKICSLWCG